MNLKICRKYRFRRTKWMPACVWVRFGRNRCLKMVYFSRSVGIDFSKWRGLHDCFLGVTFCGKNIFKSHRLMNGYMKRNWKIIKWALIWCASPTPEKLGSIFPDFLKFRYLSLSAMAVYFLVCTLYIQDGGLLVSASGVSNVTWNDRQIHHRDRKSSLDGI